MYMETIMLTIAITRKNCLTDYSSNAHIYLYNVWNCNILGSYYSKNTDREHVLK